MEAWTEGRHAEDDKHVELDYELAVALANATEGASRATVLRITQTEPSHGFVAWQALVDGYAPQVVQRPGDSAAARTRDAQEVQGREGAWSLKVAEYEHQFKTIDGGTEDVRGKGDDAKRHQTGIPGGTEKIRRNCGETGDLRERDDG